MKKRIVISVLLLLSLLINNSLVLAKSGSFSTEPDELEKARQEKYVFPDLKAYFIDVDGNTKEVEVLNDATVNNKSEGIAPQGYYEGDYFYEFARYEPNYNASDDYRFFLSQVKWWNQSSEPVPLKYIQESSVTTKWDVTGKVEVDAQFKVSFLAELKAKFGLEVGYENTTYQSTTVEAQVTVKPGYESWISKYKGGGYSGGAGVWYKYYLAPNHQYVLVGTHIETGHGGWGIRKNITTYKNGESYKGFKG